jgi:antitoxin (DNA-binding transcriptional repressor) of toxin-antitoxin stability system
MMIVDIGEAANQLSQLIEAAADGEEVVIINAGLAAARLVAMRPVRPGSCFGSMKGMITIADDFDDPLPDDIIAAFEGR